MVIGTFDATEVLGKTRSVHGGAASARRSGAAEPSGSGQAQVTAHTGRSPVARRTSDPNPFHRILSSAEGSEESLRRLIATGSAWPVNKQVLY